MAATEINYRVVQVQSDGTTRPVVLVGERIKWVGRGQYTHSLTTPYLGQAELMLEEITRRTKGTPEYRIQKVACYAIEDAAAIVV